MPSGLGLAIRWSIGLIRRGPFSRILILSAIAFPLAFFLYHGLVFSGLTLQGPSAFGSVFRMYLYHWEHPEQYLAICAVAYSIPAAFLWSWVWRQSALLWTQAVRFVVVLLFAYLLASLFSGALYALHDMQAGFFPSFEVAIGLVIRNMKDGIFLGWLVLLSSFPLNVLVTLGLFLICYFLGWRVDHGAAGKV